MQTRLSTSLSWGDGYQEHEQRKFQEDCVKFQRQLFNTRPFSEYTTHINIHQVSVFSRESGTDIPSEGIFVNTAFDIRRLPDDRGYDIGNMRNVWIAAAKAPAIDTTLILVNSSDRQGRAWLPDQGGIAISWNGHCLTSVAIHELGHSFGGLGDEYVEWQQEWSWADPHLPNLSLDGISKTVKWRHLVGQEGVGTYEGGHRVKWGIYRPTNDGCMMNRDSLGRFCLVCREHLDRRLSEYAGNECGSIGLDLMWPLLLIFFWRVLRRRFPIADRI